MFSLREDKRFYRTFFVGVHICKEIWESFETMLNEKCDNIVNFKISRNFVIFGVEKNVKTDATLDFIILLGKWYVYKCKIEKHIPSVYTFTRLLEFRYRIEKHNALLDNRLSKFNVEWNFYKLLFFQDNS